MPKKMEKEKSSKEKKSISGLLERIARIEKKLDILNSLSKTMPVVVIGTAVLLGSLLYLSSVAFIPDSTFTLPQTGEETTITKDFILIYPEQYSTITLPDEVVGLSLNGFYPKDTEVTFVVKNSLEETFEIGLGEKGTEEGEYKTYWSKYAAGKYDVWVEITQPDGTKEKTETVTVDAK
ncbi:MAG: hypothetical protein PHS44_06730 [Candidatus Dojkabacteria bacterium]|nr:hypothetical protein [Candidatus Dojkabacteria bacterium]